MDILEYMMDLPSGSDCYIAIENGHRNIKASDE